MPSKKKVAKALRLIRRAEKLLRPKTVRTSVSPKTLLAIFTKQNPILEGLPFKQL